MQLLEDRVIVKPFPKEDVTAGGIIIPETAKERPERGTVLFVGEGQTLRSGERAGERIPLSVKVGDIVLYEKDAGMDMQIEEDTCIMMLETSVIAIL
jgi:chaperonin GroES